jgi:hypothetical protein
LRQNDPHRPRVSPEEGLSANAIALGALVEIGEAIKALPRDVTLRHPDVDWRGFAGLRVKASEQAACRPDHPHAPVLRTINLSHA